MRKSILLLGISLSLAVAWVMNSFLSAQTKDKPTITIDAKDLQNGTCQIIGLLGKPYGNRTQLQGVWQREPEKNRFGKRKKYRAFFFHVTHIDGRPVDEKAQIQFKDGHVFILKKQTDKTLPPIISMEYTPQLGKIVKVNAFESGGYCGESIQYPEWVQNLLDDSPAVQDPRGKRFGFHSFLFIVDPENVIDQDPLTGLSTKK